MQPPTSSDVILCLNILQCIVYILSLQGVFVVKLQQQLHMFLGEFIDIGKRHRKENKKKKDARTWYRHECEHVIQILNTTDRVVV